MRSATISTIVLTLLLSSPVFSQKPLSIPVSTYSIVARDPSTGEIGVAVQSHRFSVGITLINDVKQVDEGIPYLLRAYRQDPHWAELIERLPAAGLLPDDKALIDRLTVAMKKRSIHE
jgi:hypothetical protein